MTYETEQAAVKAAAVLIAIAVACGGCKTIDEAKDYIADYASLDKLAEKYIKPAQADDGGEGWNPSGTITRIDFGGAQSSGTFRVELRGMMPQEQSGDNEKFFLMFRAKGYPKGGNFYTVHPASERNGVRLRLQNDAGTAKVHISNSITSAYRQEPTLWVLKWKGDGKLHVTVGGEKAKGSPFEVGAWAPTSGYVGGNEDGRVFEGEWRGAAFENGGE